MNRDLVELLLGAGLGDIVIPRKDFVKEHRHLITLLNQTNDPVLRKEASTQKKELEKELAGGNAKAGFIRRMMWENKHKHKGEYKRPVWKLADDSKMKEPWKFKYTKIANREQNGENVAQYGASPFLTKHFGSVRAEDEEDSDEDNAPPPPPSNAPIRESKAQKEARRAFRSRKKDAPAPAPAPEGKYDEDPVALAEEWKDKELKGLSKEKLRELVFRLGSNPDIRTQLNNEEPVITSQSIPQMKFMIETAIIEILSKKRNAEREVGKKEKAEKEVVENIRRRGIADPADFKPLYELDEEWIALKKKSEPIRDPKRGTMRQRLPLSPAEEKKERKEKERIEQRIRDAFNKNNSSSSSSSSSSTPMGKVLPDAPVSKKIKRPVVAKTEKVEKKEEVLEPPSSRTLVKFVRENSVEEVKRRLRGKTAEELVAFYEKDGGAVRENLRKVATEIGAPHRRPPKGGSITKLGVAQNIVDKVAE